MRRSSLLLSTRHHPSVLLSLPPHLLFVSKPSGMLSHPSSAVSSLPSSLPSPPSAAPSDPTLVDWAKAHVLSTRGTQYANLVGRLDRPVSGVCVVATSKKASRRLNALQQLAAASLSAHPGFQKSYLAIVRPAPANLSSLRSSLLEPTPHASSPPPSRKPSSLTYTPLHVHPPYALLSVKLHTGRKHQIRSQLAEIRLPVASDPLYGPKKASKHPGALPLHCYSVRLEHPVGQGEVIEGRASVPKWWLDRYPREIGEAAGRFVEAGVEPQEQ